LGLDGRLGLRLACSSRWRRSRPGAAPFLAELLGVEGTPAVTTTIALALIVLTTGLNLSGTRLLARVAMFGFVCELIGAIVVGSYLLIFAATSRGARWSIPAPFHPAAATGRPF